MPLVPRWTMTLPPSRPAPARDRMPAMPASTPRLTTASMLMPGTRARRLGAASSITESPMAVIPVVVVMLAVPVGFGRAGGVAGGGKDRLGVGMGVDLSAGAAGLGLGLGVGV